MSETGTKTKQGTFCWVDLMTTDQEGAKSFYTQLFGWTTEDIPFGDEGNTYTMLQLDGIPAAALSKMPAELEGQGIPPQWSSYISVESADETTEQAKSLGATIMKEPFDVMEVGRMSVIQDPTGAVFCTWQAKNWDGENRTPFNVPGSLTWNELATRDVESAKRFYTELFGWSENTQNMGEHDYTAFMDGEDYRAGMMSMDQMGIPAQVPPHWMVYFAVADTDATVEQAKSLGATIQVEPRDIPETGRFAIISDPQGGTFAVIKLLNPPS